MDYRKDMRTPKDRVDDELLARLLRETDELIAGCGCESDRRPRKSGCTARRDDGDNRSCGCGNNRNDRENVFGCSNSRKDRRDDDRPNISLGCGQNRADRRNDRDNGCGCGEYRRDDRDNGCCESRRDENCGCIDHHSLSIQTQGLPLVMSYCPDHEFHELYEDEEALHSGTLFRGLNFSFYGSKCGNKSDKKCGCSE